MTVPTMPSDGSDVGPDALHRVQPFVEAGLVQLVAVPVIYAAEVADPSAVDDPDDVGCHTWLAVPAPRADEVVCDRCGQRLWFEPQHIRQRFVARVNRHAVGDWLEARLGHEGAVTRLRGGCAWRVEVHDDELTVVVLDYSEDTKWVATGRMCHEPTLLVLVEPARYRTALVPGVVAVDLQTLVGGQAWAPLWAAVRTSRPETPPPRAWQPTHTLPSRSYCRLRGAHRLVAGDGQLRLDGVALAGAPVVAPLVRWLVARHAEDVAVGKSTDAHCWWPAQELADELSEPRLVSRDQIKRALQRFVRDMSARYTEATGLSLPIDAVIQSSRAGYRLNPAVYGRLG